MGTATAIGGPPLALLYQHHEGPVLRATLATFALGTGLSVVGLTLAGDRERLARGAGAGPAPGTLLGVAASSRLVGRLDEGLATPAVLTVRGGGRHGGRGRGLA